MCVCVCVCVCVYIYIYIYTHTHTLSSQQTDYMNSFDSLYQPSHLVSQLDSIEYHTEPMNVRFCWLANIGMSKCSSAQENIMNMFILTSPAVPSMSCSLLFKDL